MARPPSLLVFDFDHTICNDNTDTFVHRAAPGGVLPAAVSGAYITGHWTEFMNVVFAYLGGQAKASPADLEALMRTVPLTPGMAQLLAYLRTHADHFDCIIASDSNELFISWVLSQHGLSDVFRAAFTNFATVQPNGCLLLKPHHQHSCPTCPANMCKGAILAEYLQRVQPYQRILYVGDGRNDLCPCTTLRAGDTVFCRAGYALEKLAREHFNKDGMAARAPAIVAWETGADILQCIRALASE